MGFREFTEAVKELTGSSKKKEADKKSLPVEELEKAVEELKKAVEEDGIQPVREIRSPSVQSAPPQAPVFEASASAPESAPERAAERAPEKTPESAREADAADNFAQSATPPDPFANFRQIVEPDNAGEITIVSKNTIVYGNIRSFADMNIEGDVKGDVETTKNLDLNGKIVGNITCNNAFMNMSQVKGNIRMKGNVNMKREALLIGDIMSTYADLNGKVKGNLDIAGKVELRNDAVVFGDINASTITVEDGAIIQGYVNTTFLNKEDGRNWFPETIAIGTGV